MPSQNQPEQSATSTTSTEGQRALSEPVQKVNLASQEVQLSRLSSFRIEYTLSLTGKDRNGNPRQETIRYLQEVTTNPPVQRVRLTQEGSENINLEIFTTGNTRYYLDGDRCFPMSTGDNPNRAILTPENFWEGLVTGKVVERDVTIDGILADRYEVSEPTTGMFVQRGDAWIAREGGFVVRYVASVTGTMQSPYPDAVGTLEYRVSGVNALPPIQIPQRCLGSDKAAELPTLPGAREVSRFGNVFSFEVDGAPASTAEAYRAAMTAQGWTEKDFFEAGQTYFAEFAKGEQTASVSISASSKSQGTSAVMVVLSD